MGADIHLVVEKKHGDHWVGVDTCRGIDKYEWDEGKKKWQRGYHFRRCSSRNYLLFGKLANVRSSGPAPKGMPSDASQLSLLMADEWDGDGHSHSYCSIQEYIEALMAAHSSPAEIFLGDHPATKDPYGFFFGMDEPSDPSQYRVVFFFDN